jgi:hypothetical protein
MQQQQISATSTLHFLLLVQLVTSTYEDLISPLKAITEQPFWIPSQSLQLKMLTHAHTLIEVLNQVRIAAFATLFSLGSLFI